MKVNGSNPQVALLLSVYNGELYLSDFMESIVNQSCKNFVLFVRDDGSTDESIDIISSYANKIDIIFITSSGNLGPAYSFIELLKEADSYELYGFADQDDVWHEDKITRAVDYLKIRCSEPALYCSRQEFVSSDLSHLAYSKIVNISSFENALIDNIVVGCTSFINAQARKLIIKELPSLIKMHDAWCYLVVSAFGEVHYDTWVSIKYRQHDKNTVGASLNTFNVYYNRLLRFINSSSGFYYSYLVALEFDRIHGKKLSNQKSHSLSIFLESKKSLLGKLKLLTYNKIRRQSLADNIILKLLIVVGKY